MRIFKFYFLLFYLSMKYALNFYIVHLNIIWHNLESELFFHGISYLATMAIGDVHIQWTKKNIFETHTTCNHMNISLGYRVNNFILRNIIWKFTVES